MRYPPGPRHWDLGYLAVRRIRRDPIGFYTDLRARYGDIVYMRLGPYRDYTVFHPDLVKEVLVTRAKCFHKMTWQRKVFRQWNGDSLLLTEGEEWLRQRRLVQPAFHPRRLANYAQAMVGCTSRMLDALVRGGVGSGAWSDTADSPLTTHHSPETTYHEIEVVKAMTDLTINIIAKTMFDVDLSGTARQIGEAVAVLNDVAMYEMMHPIRLPDWIPRPYSRRKRWAMQFLDTTIRRMIRDRRASGEDHGDLLSMLLLAVDEEGDGGRLTDEQVRNEAMTLLLAGHDTTAAGVSWAFYVLGRYPEIHRRVVAEIEQVCGEHLPTATDVARLRYTEMVLKETLRMYPPAIGTFGRQAVVDTEIAGYPIRKGSLVHTLSYPIQHDPRWYPEPEKFDPERFAPGRAEQIPQYAYFPFGGGPRACIGNIFAMMEMSLIVATVLQRFDVAVAPGQGDAAPLVAMSLRPKGGVRLRLTQRAAVSVPA